MQINKMKKLLYRSFDENLNKKDKNKLERALLNDPGLRKEKSRILKQRQLIATGKNEDFSPGFTRRLMARIEDISQDENQMESAYELMKVWFRRTLAAGAVIVFVLVTLNLTMKNLSPENEIFYASSITYDEIQNLPLF